MITRQEFKNQVMLKLIEDVIKTINCKNNIEIGDTVTFSSTVKVEDVELNKK